MQIVLFSRVRQGSNLIQQLRDGDPFTIAIIILIPVITILVVWLVIAYYKRQMRRLADALGFDSEFSPNGLFGKEIYELSGQLNGVDVTVTTKKIRKGDYRTYLAFANPSQLTWEAIQTGLSKTKRKILNRTKRHDSEPDELLLEIPWVGGDIDGLVILLQEISQSIRARSKAAQPRANRD